ncbi:hypothetical protein PMI40_03491 [Herbaspirillum sp. YR522]|nr:hypothetical protein PMI40_03491 [Herbaspirillum sp. YR522]
MLSPFGAAGARFLCPSFLAFKKEGPLPGGLPASPFGRRKINIKPVHRHVARAAGPGGLNTRRSFHKAQDRPFDSRRQSRGTPARSKQSIFLQSGGKPQTAPTIPIATNPNATTPIPIDSQASIPTAVMMVAEASTMATCSIPAAISSFSYFSM